ncbi:MAG: carbamoyltransferase N-terminal domain-containing protein, partial [Halanaerobiales bacterium]
IDFPRALRQEKTYDFSFSGLKTAVINYVHNKKQKQEKYNIADIAASFQQAVIDILVERVIKAVREYEIKSVTLAGGVAANGELRRGLKEELSRLKIPLYYPPLELCTDNAAMIASVAYFKYINEDFSPLSLDAVPNLSL